MDDKEGRKPAEANPVLRNDSQAPKEAFDRWLDRNLHRLFDSVATEPVPDELMKLLGGKPDKPPSRDR